MFFSDFLWTFLYSTMQLCMISTAWLYAYRMTLYWLYQMLFLLRDLLRMRKSMENITFIDNMQGNTLTLIFVIQMLLHYVTWW